MKRELLLTTGLMMVASPALAQTGIGYTPPPAVYAPLNIVVAGADPTGATNAAPIINAELSATPNGVLSSVYGPCGTYHITSALTVGSSTAGQTFSGDGDCTILDISTDFSSSALGAIVLAGQTPSQAQGTGPTVKHLQIQFHQPPDLPCTVAVAAPPGATSITLNACSGLVTNDLAVDITTANAFSQQSKQSSSTIVTAINGNTITISPAVLAGVTAAIGDTIDFAQPRANWVSLPNCTLVPGSPGCKYPYAIYASGAGIVTIDDVRFDSAWDSIYVHGGGGGTEGPTITRIKSGAFDNSLDMDNVHNFAQVSLLKTWNYGMGTSIGGGPALEQVLYDGNTKCVNLGATDGSVFSGIQCWSSRFITTANWTFGTLNSLEADGNNSDFEFSGATVNTGASISSIYQTGVPAGGRCGINIYSGGVWNISSFTIGNSLAAGIVCPQGAYAGTLMLNNGTLYSSSGNPGLNATNSGAASLNVSNTQFLGAAGATSDVLVQMSSLDTLTFIGNNSVQSHTSHTAIAGLTDSASNIVEDNNFNGWVWTPPGTLGIYQGQITSSTLTGTLTGGTLAPGAITGAITSTATITGGTLSPASLTPTAMSGSITNTSTLSALNVSGSATLASASATDVVFSGSTNNLSVTIPGSTTSAGIILVDAGGNLALFGQATTGAISNTPKLNANTSGNPVVISVSGEASGALRFSAGSEVQINAHPAVIGGGTPTAATCEGTGTVLANSTDGNWQVTGGASTSTNCVIQWGSSWVTNGGGTIIPNCIVGVSAGSAVAGLATWVESAGSITITTAVTDTGVVFKGHCFGKS